MKLLVILFFWVAPVLALGVEVRDQIVDPTKPLGVTSEKRVKTSEGLRLQGIYQFDGLFKAVINNALVVAGENVGGALILNILEDRVVVLKGQKRSTLMLKKNILQPSLSGD